MAGYNVFLPDTAQRQKIIGAAESFAPSMDQLSAYQRAAQQQQLSALQQQFGAAQQSIGSQFTPAFRLAQANSPSPSGERPSWMPNSRKCTSGLMPDAATSGFAAR